MRRGRERLPEHEASKEAEGATTGCNSTPNPRRSFGHSWATALPAPESSKDQSGPGDESRLPSGQHVEGGRGLREA